MASRTSPWIVEAKVIASTAAATLVGTAVGVLNTVPGDSQLMGATPSWLQAFILVAAPPAAVFLAGWQARHTPRPGIRANGE
jgi:hypothetical protein